MKFRDLFKLSTRMFKARTSRTLLTILGMSVGIAAILFLVSLGYGLQKTLLERITTSDALLTLDISEAKAESIKLNRETVEIIKNIEGVGEISPSFQLTVQGKFQDLSADLVAIGAEPSFLRLGGVRMLKGDALKDDAQEGIVISSSISQVYGKTIDEMVGQDITFTAFVPKENTEENNLESETQKVEIDKVFKIIGVIETDENIAYINSAALSQLNIDHFSQLKVKCDSNQVMGGIRDQIISMGLLVSSLSETVDQANKVFGVIQIILMLFGFIALIVSAIGMFNTMTITLLERTEEIGIMKSIGASNGGISAMFIMEATVMGFFGGLGGILIGFLGGKIFNFLINFIATRFGGQSVTLFYSPAWFVATILVFGAFVGLSTGIIPARRASKIDSLDALRYK